jgi:hypothetical protein
MGRRKRDGNHFPPKNKLAQDSKRNEQNGYPDADSNQRNINYAKEPSKPHKITLKEDIL